MRQSVIIFNDGFAWKVVTKNAYELLRDESIYLFAIDVYQQMEWSITTDDELEKAVKHNYPICTEVGYVDLTRFISRRIDDDKVVIDGSIYIKLKV